MLYRKYFIDLELPISNVRVSVRVVRGWVCLCVLCITKGIYQLNAIQGFSY